MRARRLLPLLLWLAAPACHGDGDATLLVVVTASGTPPSVAQLAVRLSGPAGLSSWNVYTRNDDQPIAFPTTLSASVPPHATGTLEIDVDARDSGSISVASGHGGPVTIHAGERQTVYVRLDCSGDTCVVDAGAPTDGDGGMPTPTPRCGNGIVDVRETCDTAIAAREPGACPSSCDDNVPCTRDTPTGSDCTAACRHEEIFAVVHGDGCCPAGAQDRDSDCSKKCDNGVVDPGETCDTLIMHGVAGACPKMPSDCAPAGACVKGTDKGVEGDSSTLVSAGTCSAVCVHYPIVAQSEKEMDGCCPPGATHSVDEDCATACGNGVIDEGENCDTGISPLAPDACPTTCDDNDPCTTDSLLGAGCTRSCQHVRVTAPVSGDGCCLKDPMMVPIFSRAQDTDCAPKCHNGFVEPGETCDADCPTSCPAPPVGTIGTLGCVRVELVGSSDDCSARCVMVEEATCRPVKDGCCPAGCTAATDPDCSRRCGNGGIDFFENEECDIGAAPVEIIACPMSCADGNACTDDRLISAGTCSARCVSVPTTAFRPGDGCCPPNSGGTFLADPDCAPVCGNGVVESPAERCDFGIPGSCPDAVTCPQQQQTGCMRYTLQGQKCSATCVQLPITDCVGGDDCCPPDCLRAEDSDCPIICGDGLVEGNESCDRGITAGAPGACPRSCDDGIACTLDFASGSAEGCTRTCVHQPITSCVKNKDDGCCPQGCSSANDADCDPRCGDGHIGAGETCDPPSTCPTACPDDGDPCTREELTGDAAACSAACRHFPITACSGGARDSCCPTGCSSTNDRDC